MLEKLWAKYPDHPGLPHYIIHARDCPADRRQAVASDANAPFLKMLVPAEKGLDFVVSAKMLANFMNPKL